MKNIIIKFTGRYDGMNSFAVEPVGEHDGMNSFVVEPAAVCPSDNNTHIGGSFVRSTYGAKPCSKGIHSVVLKLEVNFERILSNFENRR